MAQLINKPIVNGLTPVSHNGKIVACTADGRVVGGLRGDEKQQIESDFHNK